MKLYRFSYSPYARKVQLLLDLLGHPYSVIDVPYSDRAELATLTGGYIHVPVLVDDDGQVVCDSRRICQHLLTGLAAARWTPPTQEGPIWAYSDWCDGPLEDVLFRIASPIVQTRWPDPGDRALYTLIKERKFGAGCVDDWRRNREALTVRANEMLAPTARTLEAQPFLFGGQPTLADVALYGQFAMLHAAEPAQLGAFPRIFARWIAALEDSAPRPLEMPLRAR